MRLDSPDKPSLSCLAKREWLSKMYGLALQTSLYPELTKHSQFLSNFSRNEDNHLIFINDCIHPIASTHFLRGRWLARALLASIWLVRSTTSRRDAWWD